MESTPKEKLAKRSYSSECVTTLEDLRLAFDCIDADKSGSIVWKDFLHMMKKIDPLIEEADVLAFFRKMDTNQDQRIGWDEFVAMMGKCKETFEIYL